MSWLGLIPQGIETAVNLGGAISNVATAKDRKKKFLEENKAEMLHQLRRQRAASLGFPVGSDAAYSMQKLNRQADEQFKIDPASFVPFVKSASKLANNIYNEAQPSAEDELAEQEKQRQIRTSLSQTDWNNDSLARAESLKYYGRY